MSLHCQLCFSFQFQYRGAYTYDTKSILSPVYGAKKVEHMCSPEYDKLKFEKEDRRTVIRYHCMALMDMTEKRYPGRYDLLKCLP